MSHALKQSLISNGCMEHVMEFGRCTGIVIGSLDYNNIPETDPSHDPNKVGPEVDVRWLPSTHRFGYAPEQLDVVRYDARIVEDTFKVNFQSYYIKLAAGQSPTWKCDERTAQLFGLTQYLMDQLILLEASDKDRRAQLAFFDRKSRAENDLFSLVALALNNFLDRNIDKYTGR